MTPAPPMTEAQKAEIRRIARIFGKGCSNAGTERASPRFPDNPADCAECLETFVEAIEDRLAEWGMVATPERENPDEWEWEE